MKGSEGKDNVTSTGNLKVVSHLPIFQPPNTSSLALHPYIWIAFLYLPNYLSEFHSEVPNKHYILCDTLPHLPLKIYCFSILCAFLFGESCGQCGIVQISGDLDSDLD